MLTVLKGKGHMATFLLDQETNPNSSGVNPVFLASVFVSAVLILLVLGFVAYLNNQLFKENDERGSAFLALAKTVEQVENRVCPSCIAPERIVFLWSLVRGASQINEQDV